MYTHRVVFLTDRSFLGARGATRREISLQNKRQHLKFIFRILSLCPERKLPGINASLLTWEANIKEISSSISLDKNLHNPVLKINK